MESKEKIDFNLSSNMGDSTPLFRDIGSFNSTISTQNMPTYINLPNDNINYKDYLQQNNN